MHGKMFGFGDRNLTPNSDSSNKARQFTGYWGAFVMAGQSHFCSGFSPTPRSWRWVGL
jgi:hypothetical protein